MHKHDIASTMVCRGVCKGNRVRDDAVQPEGSSMRDIATLSVRDGLTIKPIKPISDCCVL